MEGTSGSALCKFTTVTWSEEDVNKIKTQAMQEYWNDTIQNEKTEKDSWMNVAGILSYDRDEYIESWMQNGVDNLTKYTIKLPVDWPEVFEINMIEERHNSNPC